MKVGGIKLRATPTKPFPNVAKQVQRASTKVKGPLAKGTKGLSAGPKPPRIK
jgi:hypothetical protein